MPHVLHVRELYPRVRARVACLAPAAARSGPAALRLAGRRGAVLRRREALSSTTAWPRPPARRPGAARARRSGSDQDTFAVAVLGRVSAWKGQDVLARALAEPPLASHRRRRAGRRGAVAGRRRPAQRARADARHARAWVSACAGSASGRSREGAGRGRRRRRPIHAAGPVPERGARGGRGRRAGRGRGSRRAPGDAPRRRDRPAGRAGYRARSRRPCAALADDPARARSTRRRGGGRRDGALLAPSGCSTARPRRTTTRCCARGGPIRRCCRARLATPIPAASERDGMSGGIRTRSRRSNITNAASAPPISPPRWPPIEIPGIANVKSRLMPSQTPRPLSIGLMPRLRITTTAAPIRPKIAPEAPPSGRRGSNRSAPNEPASSETK